MRGQTTIAIFVDGSEHAENAFNYYKDVMNRPEHQVIIIHVSEVVPLSTLEQRGAFGWTHVISVNKGVIDAKLEAIKHRNEELEKEYNQKCKDANIQNKFITLPGDNGVEEAIMDYLKANDVTGIVMGTRGQGPLLRKLMGSVSHHLLHHSHIPVTVCPPPKEEQS